MIINETNKENEKKESIDIIQICLNIDEEKYIIKIYSSKDETSIIFKIEQEKIQTFYFYEKFDLRDFKQKNKKFISNENIKDAFNTLKEIIEKNTTKLEKKSLKMNLIFLNKSEIIVSFSLRKKIVSQNRLNPLLVEQIQDNKSKITLLAKKFDKSIQEQNDIINNINKKIDIINNSIKNIIFDLDKNNKTIISIKNEQKNNNILKNENNEKLKKSSFNNDGDNNNNKKLNLNEKKNINVIKDNNSIIYENKKEKLWKNKTLYHILLNIILLIYIANLYFYFYKLNKDFKLEKIKEEKLRQKFFIFDYLNKLNDEDLNFIEKNIKSLKEEEKYNNLKNQQIYVIHYFNDKIKIFNNTNNISNSIKHQNINYKNKTNNEEQINHINKDNNQIKEINSYNNKTNKSYDYKNDVYNSKEINNQNIKECNENQKFLLENIEDINYFKNKIKQKTQYKIKDVNLVLKYKSGNSEYKDFYNNCRGISQNLILLQNKEGKKIGIFSKNIIDIWNNIKDKNFSVDDNNFIGYIFSYQNIDEITSPDYKVFKSIYKNIFNFLAKKKHFNSNNNLNNINNDITIKEEMNFFGEIEEIEIYQIKYIIK